MSGGWVWAAAAGGKAARAATATLNIIGLSPRSGRLVPERPQRGTLVQTAAIGKARLADGAVVPGSCVLFY